MSVTTLARTGLVLMLSSCAGAGPSRITEDRGAETRSAEARAAEVRSESAVGPPRAAPLTVREGIGFRGYLVMAYLQPSGMSVWATGSNVDGQLGLPPADFIDRPLPLPERAESLFDAVSGLVVRTATGRLYGTGYARPGPEWELGRIDLPGPAEHLAASGWGTCATVRGDGVYCWGGRSIGDPPGPWSGPIRAIEGAPTEIVALASAGTRLCALEENGSLWCWNDESTAPLVQRPSRIAPDVHALDGDFNILCSVRGADRRLWCWEGGSERQFSFRNVSSLTVGPMTVCVVATDDVRTDPWVYCWGLPMGYISVGPYGFDPATLPDSLPSVRNPRPVLPVETGTEVFLLGLNLCVRTPDGATRCDPNSRETVGAWYDIELLPISTRAYPGDDAFRAERFD